MFLVDKFIAKANIEHFRKQLAQETDGAKRQLLARLLAVGEAKLVIHSPTRKQRQAARPRGRQWVDRTLMRRIVSALIHPSSTRRHGKTSGSMTPPSMTARSRS